MSDMALYKVAVRGKKYFNHVAPLAVSESGRLFVHEPIDLRQPLIIAHVGTGWGICLAKNIAQAKRRMKRLDELDWDFQQICKVPSDTVGGAIKLIKRWPEPSSKPELSDDYKQACFAEPTHRARRRAVEQC